MLKVRKSYLTNGIDNGTANINFISDHRKVIMFY